MNVYIRKINDKKVSIVLLNMSLSAGNFYKSRGNCFFHNTKRLELSYERTEKCRNLFGDLGNLFGDLDLRSELKLHIKLLDSKILKSQVQKRIELIKLSERKFSNKQYFLSYK